MSLHRSDRRVPAHSDSLPGHDDSLSRTSIRATLGSSVGRVLRACRATSPRVLEEPIRAELFGIERLEQHAGSLATAQRTAARPGTKRRLARRLRDNQRALRAAYRKTIDAVREDRTITPAANWLLDNFHVVEEQVREIRVDLPPSFYRQLPKLMEGPLEGYPRVFGLAWAFVAHTDSRFDSKMLHRFASAYQRIQPLTIGELWAIPITLRIVLVENLRRLADDIVACQAARQQADELADRVLEAGRETEPPEVALRCVEKPLRTAFSVQLIQRLCDQDPAEVPLLTCLYERLTTQGTTADDIVQEEHRRQGAVNVTVRNIITSMRLMSVVDWKEVIESISLVDAMLRAESDFAAMDFPTRDRYRSAIEELARGSKHSEIDIARLSLLAVKQTSAGVPATDEATSARERDPGHYLIGKGRAAFEKTLGFHAMIRGWLGRTNAVAGISGYLAVIGVTTAIIGALVLSWNTEPGGLLAFCVLALLALIPASDAALALVNCGAMNRFTASPLPALELSDGVPTSLRTMIAVPILLTSHSAIVEQIKGLEVHYLANTDGDLYFALLSDWPDCASENAPDDEELLRVAVDGIAELNRRHGPAPAGDRFILLHRRRLWNEAQGKWIGWERKRGKLHELNRLLRGATDTTFISTDGRSPSMPVRIRFVIILDADTQLPRGAAKRLVGKMAHPLNRPTLDPRSGRVIEGYAVLQPRVTPALPIGSEGSLFQRVFSSARGMDPYACAVSDIYQDLFGEGSYCGKGIYDVDFFEAALAGRIPENALLSHDLFEGTFARSGLASDIEVVDEFPARYDVATARQHRWVRGDWQLLPWLFGRTSNGDRRHRAIPLVGRWKMIDNLRRSLSPPACLLALVVGWTLPFASAELWSAFILTTIAIPALIPFLSGIMPRRAGLSLLVHLRAVSTDLVLALFQIVLLVTFQAHQAWTMCDAILRTLFRLFVSHRNMLEWVTAAQTKANPPLSVVGFYRQMAGGVTLGAGAAVLVACVAPHSWPIAVPFLFLWLLSPAIARWASLPSAPSARQSASGADTQLLRLVARRTWRFFETFVTAEEHMLPPDNFQEEPKPVVAHRTSPTNIGLYLSSVIAAHDFGWLGMTETVDRLEATLKTMNSLERCRGHFYNWYDTTDLRPLEPKYISSVDSGNLAGHLIVLENACRDLASRPLMCSQVFAGIGDSLDLTRDSARAAPNGSGAPIHAHLFDALDAVASSLEQAQTTPIAIAAKMAELARLADDVTSMAQPLTEDASECGNGDAESVAWAAAVGATIHSHQRDLERLMPWAECMAFDATPCKQGRDGEFDSQSEIAQLLNNVPTLAELPGLCEKATSVLMHQRTALAVRPKSQDGALNRLDMLIDNFRRSAEAAAALERRLASLSVLAREMFDAMTFDFLFDPERELLSIGYRVDDGSLDPGYYDLLASEARLASFVAIAKGDLPTRHWFRLGRSLVPLGFNAALISWSGSMFEYLMPSLIMRAPSGSLLEQTSRLVVRQQMKYGVRRGVPWGASESAYNARDLDFTYQYSSFGIPELGLKRGLAGDTVIAPYATALSTMVDAPAAARNFVQLAKAGGRGLYGWYEALDYTRTRLPEGTNVAVVRAYMAHHQGMAVIAIANALHDGAMRTYFHAEPIVRAAALLLQERMPRDIAVSAPTPETEGPIANVGELAASTQRRFNSPHGVTPRTHLLSNGSYAVMITAAGSGYSQWRDIAVTRWREDVTRDHWGSYIFLRDIDSGEMWSAGYQPSGVEADRYDVTFSEGRAELIRHDGTITTTLEVAVSSEDDAEVRRVSITNLGSKVREIELTSYAEIALAPRATDDAHPAFSKLFVETEFIADVGALLATRRQRSPADTQAWAAHLAVIEGDTSDHLQFETDRSRFLGRGREPRAPIAVVDGLPLSSTVGAVLDPIFSLRRRVRVLPQSTVRVAFWTLIASSRNEVLDLVDKHHDEMAFDRATTLAWTQAQVQLRHLGINAGEAHVFQRLANRVLFSDPTLRPSSEVLKKGGGAASKLWLHGISGDVPIVLVRIDEVSDLESVRQILLAHEYWRMKQLAVDLVLLNEQPPSYARDLQTSLEALVRTSRARPRPNGAGLQGAIFVLRADLVSIEVRNLLQAAARVVLVSRRGSLFEQVKRLPEPRPSAPPLRQVFPSTSSQVALPRPALEFFNGLGGFADNGREYVATLEHRECTPAPWINVVCNPSFGFQASVEGSGYTWALNSQQNQITPWSNDPVSDAPGEVIYVRDEDSGHIWGPTALPIHEEHSSYLVRHGQGYSCFEHVSHGISLELLQYVPIDDPIKISRLKIANHSGRSRRLSVTAYVEWALGSSRSNSAPFIVTKIDAETRAMFSQNPWSIEFGRRIAFADLAGQQVSWTGDRTEFLGRNGALDQPAALVRARPLSNRVGAGLDPCGALQTRLELEANDEVEVVFFLGQAATEPEAQSLLGKYRAADLEAVLSTVSRLWDDTLGSVQVTTPDRSMDILLNRWLLYQTLACRVWARSAFYQASGAFGFRDQLQDVMALTVSKPEVAREHLLRAAARQFVEGDVQHWWLPVSGQGIRTRVSDDRIWLSYVVAHYVEVTGDFQILEEIVPFLEGRTLRDGEHESYFRPEVSDRHDTLFEHCARGLDQSLAVGSHGLPLIGTGDWNDGLSRVGERGIGESIWLGWFLHAALTAFARLADGRGDQERAANWRRHTTLLAEALERDGWDGNWYRRAYYDDGTPLGSASSSECRIDSIAQSWSVMSRAADPTRSARAMAAVEKYLVHRDDGLVLLFAPPFDQTSLDPGYIKAYPPGIRENGGQYTHGAIWSVIAFAMLGEGDKAGELFSLLNPVNHASTPDGVRRYKVEPYVACADLYSVPPHVGRGGWTWYTGSAGWMYRAGLESILGFRLQGAELLLDPCIPSAWPDFRILFRYHSTRYDVRVENPHSINSGIARAELDGVALPEHQARIPLIDDGATHRVRIVLG
jgi:cyclic beta-1,2-glucan synthetase